MKRKLFSWILAAGTGLLSATHVSALLADERPSSMYEDDAWYDVTEWFDGNDYNPTDEQWFRWDNETYEASAAANSSDTDNDWEAYGYSETGSTDDDWYYDYDRSDYYDYGDHNRDGLYESTWNYYDYDHDGYYDAYSSYNDRDGDGMYDDYSYLTFVGTSDNTQNAANAESDAKSVKTERSSKMFSVEGEVAATKEVQTRGGQHLVAHVTKQGQKIVVDLGPSDKLDTKPSEGDTISARGPVSKVGDKKVLVAKQIELQGKSMQIDRSPRSISGTVVDTMTASPRKNSDTKHTMVKLKTDDGKQALVDLGPADKLNTEINKDQKVDVSGVAIKVKERPVLFASSVTVDGKELTIDRQRGSESSNRQASSKASSNK